MIALKNNHISTSLCKLSFKYLLFAQTAEKDVCKSYCEYRLPWNKIVE